MKKTILSSVLIVLASLTGSYLFNYVQSPATAVYVSQTLGVAVKNRIINGDMRIWQRGTTASGTFQSYVADRWQCLVLGAGAVTNERSPDVPTVSQAGVLFSYSNKIDVTTADASVTGSDALALRYAVEGYDWAPLAQQPCVFSFWFKSNKTGPYTTTVNNGASGTPDRALVQDFSYTGGSGWQKITVNIAASPSAGTWDYTNGRGVFIYFGFASGATYAANATSTSWQTVTQYAVGSTTTVNGLDSTSNEFFITGVQLEAGTTATPFEFRSFQQELAMCQRYYEKSNDMSGIPGSAAQYSSMSQGWGISTTYCFVGTKFKITKRTNPTTVIYSAANGTVGKAAHGVTGTETTGTAVVADTVGQGGFANLQSSDSPFTVGEPYFAAWAADAEL